MNEFDIVDIVYNRVVDANTGLIVYKDKSITGEVNDHIVISMLEFHELEWTNVLPVNVNIFIKNNSNGMPRRSVQKEVKTKIRKELLKIKPENGQYRRVEVQGSVHLDGEISNGIKENFSCINIKIVITTEKNINELWQE